MTLLASLAFFCCYNNYSFNEIFAFFGKDIRLLLSYHFTKKRPSKICEIENFNRQTLNKIGLIFTNEASFQAETWT